MKKGIKKFLQNIIDSDRTNLEKNIAKILLKYDDPIETMKDIIKNGLIGNISEFTYTNDIYKFFIDNIDDIVSYLDYMDDIHGVNVDLYREKNMDRIIFYVSIAVENIIENFLSELGIEY